MVFAIQVNEDTDLDDDIILDRLTEGAEIEIEGEYRNGIIVAEEIEMRDGDAELSGFIENKERGGEVLCRQRRASHADRQHTG